MEANKTISPLAIKNVLLGVDDKKYVLSEFKIHNEQVKALVPVEYSPGTLDLFKRTYLHVQQ